MQPESCHHARDPFAQGLGPYMEIPDKREVAIFLSNDSVAGLMVREREEVAHFLQRDRHVQLPTNRR